jgi:hypothetical protein
MDVDREVNNIREVIHPMAEIQPETVFLASNPGMGAIAIKGSSRGNDNLPPLPVSSIERIIAAVWAEVLAVPAVDQKANFFALGGDALLAIRCVSKLREKLPVVLSLPDFFENSTVAEQAELVWQCLRPANSTGGREFVDPSANWDQALGVMPLLTDAERQQLLVDWNNTASEYPRDVSLARLVEEQVERTPDAVAGRTS